MTYPILLATDKESNTTRCCQGTGQMDESDRCSLYIDIYTDPKVGTREWKIVLDAGAMT